MGYKDKIAHERFMLEIYERDLADGLAFMKAWPEREKHLRERIAAVPVRIKEITQRALAEQRAKTQTKEAKLKRMEDQVAKLKRAIRKEECERAGGVYIEAKDIGKRDDPTLDHYGDPLAADPD